MSWFPTPRPIGDQLEHILRTLHSIEERITTMAGELDTLKASVSRNTDVIASAIALIQGIKAALDAAIAAGDPAALTALSDTLGAQDDALAAAVAANTPVAPPPAA